VTYKLRGAGLPNVYLDGGVIFEGEGEGDEQVVCYLKLDDLYKCIARSIALRPGVLSHNELRFLRKRLGMSQTDVANLGDKSVQAAAKWEKGTSPVPKAEGDLLRIKTLTAFGSHKDILQVAQHLGAAAHRSDMPYLFKFDGSAWASDQIAAQKLAETASFEAALSANSAIAAAMLTSTGFAYTASPKSISSPIFTLNA